MQFESMDGLCWRVWLGLSIRLAGGRSVLCAEDSSLHGSGSFSAALLMSLVLGAWLFPVDGRSTLEITFISFRNK